MKSFRHLHISNISAIALIVIASLAGACASPPQAAAPSAGKPIDAPVTLNATVRDMQELGAGCSVLETSEGRYQPLDLPNQYLQDGLQVRVRLRAAPEMMSTCMLGQLVYVEAIDKGWK